MDFSPVDINGIQMDAPDSDSSSSSFVPVDINSIQMDNPPSKAAFGSNRGVTPTEPGSADDFTKSSLTGMEQAPLWLNDLSKGVEQGATRLGGAAYTAMGGDLSPEQAELLTNPPSVSGSTDILQGMGLPVHDSQTSLGVVGNMLGNAAGMGLASEASPSIIDKLKSAGEGLKGWYDDIGNSTPDVVATKPPVYDPVATHSAISDAYGAAKAGAKPYYNLMNDIASGETADASDLKPALDSMISDIQNTPFHEAASELSYLKQQSAKIGEDGTIPLNDMVKLKQNLNNNFNPKRFSQGTDTPYSVVGGIVDDSLDDAASRIPEFGEAKSLADKNWLNTVKAPFEDNTVLQEFWKPEDYYAKKSVDNGMLEELPDPTQQRAQTMLNGIKTPVQLNAVRRVLPQDMADALSTAKIQDITQGNGANRLNSAGKALMGSPNLTPSGIGKTLTNVGQAIGGVPLTQAQKDLIAVAKTPSPVLSTKYQQPFSNLKANIQQQKDLAGEMMPFGAAKPAVPTPPPPAPTLALPDIANSTERPLIGGRGKQPRPATDEEWQNIIDSDDQAKKMGLSMDVRKAQQQALISKYERQNPANNFFNQIGSDQLKINQTALHPDTGDVRELFPDDDSGFAKGGLAKNKAVHLSKKLEVKLGRKPKAREIELATYVGAHGVHRLLKQKDASMPAHKMFPQETVKEKRELFFNKKKPYTVAQIKAVLN